MSAPPELPEFDEEASMARWSDVLFKPPRAQLDRALGVPDPPDRAPSGLSPGAWRAWRETQQAELAREHWENLVTRGVVPESWLASGERRFLGTRAVHAPERGRTSTTFQLALFEHPPTVDAAIALASDLPNVLAVEQLVREADRRCTPRLMEPYEPNWEGQRVPLLWDVSATPSHPGLYGYAPPSALSRALLSAFFTAERGRSYGSPLPRANLLARVPAPLRTWCSWAVLCERLDAMLARAIDLGLPWPSSANDRESRRTPASFADVTDNPYETALEILRRGYAFYGRDGQHRALRIEALTA